MTLVFGHATASKSLIFSGFTPFAARICWHMSAHGSTIQAATLLLVKHLNLPIVADDLNL
jgi:hypothetical protein